MNEIKKLKKCINKKISIFLLAGAHCLVLNKFALQNRILHCNISKYLSFKYGAETKHTFETSIILGQLNHLSNIISKDILNAP